jgi:hypothetical protein
MTRVLLFLHAHRGAQQEPASVEGYGGLQAIG